MENYTEIMQILCKFPRPAGSSQIKEIKSYLLSMLSKMNYCVQVQTVVFEGWELIKEPRVKFVEPVEKEAKCMPVVWSSSISKDKISGKLEYVGKIKTFEAYEWERYAIVNPKVNSKKEKKEILAYLITREDMVWIQSLDNPFQKTPYIIIDTESCKMIKQWIKENKEIMVLASVKSKYVPGLNINNVIASPKSKDCDVIVCTHYDSMFNTVGAHDNASGTAALIGLAERFSKKILKNSNVRFIFFDAEEWNKFGSYAYVEKIKNEGELQKLKFVLNIDSVGFGDSINLLTSPAIENKVREIVSKTSVAKKIKIDVSSKNEIPQLDCWPFMKNGIAVITIGTKGKPPVTKLKEGESIFHNSKDTIENIQFEIIESVVSLVEEFLENYLA
ncbi:MAG: M28 family peptidase [Candidatus Micrarchaeota archaeon]